MAWEGLKKAVREEPQGVAAVLSTVIAQTEERARTAPSVRDELAQIIENESRWEPSATNPIPPHATGLIQFMPQTAVTLGTTTDQLRRMNRAQQAPFVQRYFDRTTGNGRRQVKRVGDLYLLTFSPNDLDRPDDFVIAAPGSAVWRDNSGLRVSPEGPITAGSVRQKGTPRAPFPTDFSAPGQPTPTPAPGQTPVPGIPGVPVPGTGMQPDWFTIVLLGIWLASRGRL